MYREVALLAVLLGLPLSTAMGQDTAGSSAVMSNVERQAAYERGKAVYRRACARCHDAGQRGAPRLFDAEQWHASTPDWRSRLRRHVVLGVLSMPPTRHAGVMEQTDIEDAVEYMADVVETLQLFDPAPSADQASGQADELTRGTPTPSSTSELGKTVYRRHCATCHDTGNRGAPRIRNPGTWTRRYLNWRERLKAHATRGLIAMPPLPHTAPTSDRELHAAVEYMADVIEAFQIHQAAERLARERTD